MTLKRFLNVAYAVLVDEYTRLGVDLMAALEKVEEVAETKRTDEGPKPVPKAVAASNSAAAAALQAMMASVQGGPKVLGSKA